MIHPLDGSQTPEDEDRAERAAIVAEGCVLGHAFVAPCDDSDECQHLYSATRYFGEVDFMCCRGRAFHE